MKKPITTLIIEDSEDDTGLLVDELRKGGFDPDFECVQTPEALTDALKTRAWDLIISDYPIPQFSGLEALKIFKATGIDIPFILVTGTTGENSAVEAMKAGAHDYVIKGNLDRLVGAIERELKEAQNRRERNEAQEWLKYLAKYDPLTDLPNRNLMYERLEEEIVAHCRERKPMSFMLIDLDQFREINDAIGHQAGDYLLQKVGRRLRSALAKDDTVARLGGDEFGMLLANTDEQSAIAAADRLLKLLEQPFSLDRLTLNVRGSIGIAVFPNHAREKNALFRCADVAMYQAKQNGTGFAAYCAARDAYSTERLELMADLNQSIDKNQLFLVYQPKVNLGSGTITGVESLVRWQHPNGMIPPDRFIPMAEQTGFIKSLTKWGLCKALAQAKDWIRQGIEASVSVNLSPRVLHDDHFADHVGQTLREIGVAPEHLEFEITESLIMADPARALQILTKISCMGVSLSIDDFGTGYSSLAYLKKLPVDKVKIDKSFVLHMTEDQNDAQIVRSTIELAHNLGLKVIAEGVEDREAFNCLCELGCDEVQGYYLSRPLPATEITNWFRQSEWKVKTPERDGHPQNLYKTNQTREW
jgi:diguanylate cyclase